jgi:undecaprenyl-diphosphatase
MLETLAVWDLELFRFINLSLANPVTDALMPVITSGLFLRSLYGLAMLLILWKGDRKLRWVVLVSAITIALTDQISSSLLKNWIERPRPCHIMSDLHLLVNCGAGYAMPSAHAANAFGQAVLFAVIYPKINCYLLSFAFLVALSRVFVGVHYPADILAGACVGSAIGLITAISFRQIWRKLAA